MGRGHLVFFGPCTAGAVCHRGGGVSNRYDLVMLFGRAPYRPQHIAAGSPRNPRHRLEPSDSVLAPTVQDATGVTPSLETASLPVISRTSLLEQDLEATAGPSAYAGELADLQAAESVGSVAATPAKSVARSSLVMFFGTFVSRLLGLVRSPILLGAVVGMTTPAGNAFDVANQLPTQIYMVIVGGLVNAILVPAIVRATKSSKDSGASFINKLLTISIVFLGIATLVITLAAPLIVKMFAATMPPQWYSLTVAFAYWCLPQIFFYGLYTVLGQILNARENFGPYMWAPVLNNVIAIAGLVLILSMFGAYDPESINDAAVWTTTKVALLGGFSTLGIALQALVLIWPLYRLGVRYKPDFRWKNTGLASAGKASWWVLLTMVIGLIPTMAQSNAAVGATARADELGMNLYLVAGNYVYTTSYMIYSIPTSLIVVSIATAMFTRLASHAVDENLPAMRRDVSKTLRMVSTLTLLCSVLMIVLALPIARILALTQPPDVVSTLSHVVMAMCLGLVGVGAVTVLTRTYYAFEEFKAAFLLNLPFQVTALVGFLLCMLLPPQFTVIGIGLVMSVTNVIFALVLAVFLRGRMGGLDSTRVISTHLRLFGIALVTGVLGFLVMIPVNNMFHLADSILGSFGAIIIVAPLLTLLYFSLMKVLRMDELKALVGPLKRILKKVGIRK